MTLFQAVAVLPAIKPWLKNLVAEEESMKLPPPKKPRPGPSEHDLEDPGT